jgi:hypothetical protein
LKKTNKLPLLHANPERETRGRVPSFLQSPFCSPTGGSDGRHTTFGLSVAAQSSSSSSALLLSQGKEGAGFSPPLFFSFYFSSSLGGNLTRRKTG